MMNQIISSAESFEVARPDLIGGSFGGKLFRNKSSSCNEAAIAKASVMAATKRNATAILVLASQGPNLPRLVSAYRPDVPIVTFTPSAKIAKHLIIYRGIHPVVGQLEGITFHKRPAVAIKYAKDMGFVQSGDDVIIVGIEDEDEKFVTMKVAAVP
jgi:pyruvate kinase